MPKSQQYKNMIWEINANALFFVLSASNLIWLPGVKKIVINYLKNFRN